MDIEQSPDAQHAIRRALAQRDQRQILPDGDLVGGIDQEVVGEGLGGSSHRSGEPVAVIGKGTSQVEASAGGVKRSPLVPSPQGRGRRKEERPSPRPSPTTGRGGRKIQKIPEVRCSALEKCVCSAVSAASGSRAMQASSRSRCSRSVRSTIGRGQRAVEADQLQIIVDAAIGRFDQRVAERGDDLEMQHRVESPPPSARPRRKASRAPARAMARSCRSTSLHRSAQASPSRRRRRTAGRSRIERNW